MQPARASDTNGDLRSLLRAIARQQEIDQCEEPLEKRLRRGIGFNVCTNRRIVAGQRLQAGYVVGVTQEAHVKKQIESRRRAMLEPESNYCDRGLPERLRRKLMLQSRRMSGAFRSHETVFA